jgi:hypothetical protein
MRSRARDALVQASALAARQFRWLIIRAQEDGYTPTPIRHMSL